MSYQLLIGTSLKSNFFITIKRIVSISFTPTGKELYNPDHPITLCFMRWICLHNLSIYQISDDSIVHYGGGYSGWTLGKFDFGVKGWSHNLSVHLINT